MPVYWICTEALFGKCNVERWPSWHMLYPISSVPLEHCSRKNRFPAIISTSCTRVLLVSSAFYVIFKVRRRKLTTEGMVTENKELLNREINLSLLPVTWIIHTSLLQSMILSDQTEKMKVIWNILLFVEDNQQPPNIHMFQHRTYNSNVYNFLIQEFRSSTEITRLKFCVPVQILKHKTNASV
jgi:hypothetical protein